MEDIGEIVTGKEKLKAVFSRQTSPVPFDLGGTPTTGVHCSMVEKLRNYYGLEKRPVHVYEPMMMLGQIDSDLQKALGTDVINYPGYYDVFGLKHDTLKEWKSPWGQTVLFPEEFEYTKDEKGSFYIHARGDVTAPPSGMMSPDGYYFQPIYRQQPIDDDNLNVEDNLEEFGLLDSGTINFLKSKRAEAEKSGLAYGGIPGGTSIGDIALVPGTMLKNPKGIRGMEEWYISTITRTDYLCELFDRQTDIALKNMETYWEIVGDSVDVIFLCGTDFATQNSLFCSPETFRNVYMPAYKKMNSWIHKNTTWKTMKHSCGAVEPLIEAFIECGFDILNPLQWNTSGMDRELIKTKYGSRIILWGGGVDTQKTLPFGTPEAVRREVLECLEIFARDGGYVFNPVHNIQAKTPIENVIAMIDALAEFNGK